ncbi:MAG TPA: lipoate--protein ligase family protein [Aquificaceae bacterium]|nr:lipoate--protein ligase family protein [Aquificaceae bacterium]
MKIYRAGKQGNLRSITLFHAMARLGYEGLIITTPTDTYVSVGYFDKTDEIIDVKRCKELCIPVIRREVGGGAVLLHEDQVFYQLIINKKRVPFKVIDAYQKFSKPVVEVYRKLGVEVEYKPVNDLVVAKNKKKISGQGAADIEDSFVFVGGILLRFNTKLMAELFKVPEEKFRDKIYKNLEENITWVKRETGRLPSYEEVEELLIKEFSKIIDFKGEAEVPKEAIELADRLKDEFTSKEVLFEDTGRKHRAIKLREGVYFRTGLHKAKGGLIRAEIYTDGEKIVQAKIYGDFTLYPKSKIKDLEKCLEGVKFEREEIEKVLEYFMKEVEFPGVEAKDLLIAIYGN